jgi:hypothetical protein
MFSQAGFNVERIEWLEGSFGTCGYMLQVIYRYLPTKIQAEPPWPYSQFLFLPSSRRISLFAAAVFCRLDLRWKVTDLGFPINYVVLAGKPHRQAVS